MTDPIADMLTRIRNATMSRHGRVDMPSSRLKVEIARILESEGYIQGFKVLGRGHPDERVQAHLRVFLKYGPRASASSPDRAGEPARAARLRRRDDVPNVLAGLGTAILTTSRGVMTGREAIKVGVGGEVLCNVW